MVEIQSDNDQLWVTLFEQIDDFFQHVGYPRNFALDEVGFGGLRVPDASVRTAQKISICRAFANFIVWRPRETGAQGRGAQVCDVCGHCAHVSNFGT